MIREEAEHSIHGLLIDMKTIQQQICYYRIGMDEIYNDVLKEYVMPLSYIYVALEGKGWDDMKSENFLFKYKPMHKDIFLYIMIKRILLV